MGKTMLGTFAPLIAPFTAQASAKAGGRAREDGQEPCRGSGAADILCAFARWGSLSAQARRFWIDHAIVYSLTRSD